MWFISILAIIAILWFLYVIAQNTSENLENQREILRELKNLKSGLNELSTRQAPAPSVEQKLISPDPVYQKVNSNTSMDSLSEEIRSESDNLININTAELNELQSLPGVGKVVAQKIIDARPFESIESLADVSGVSSELMNKLKSRVTI